ncbi:hypothetical protein TBK1r_35480 [Stieleria magnilauensis]|uniref:Uncharacterized protein n=1 Tax=Stieleria magnilauensis TaxID=2527963 RepID=A0ABX5XS64_9BACT|nr:hypothetical protein TBK1r_35480 [Planctomycetes bacterium TBK1r]
MPIEAVFLKGLVQKELRPFPRSRPTARYFGNHENPLRKKRNVVILATRPISKSRSPLLVYGGQVLGVLGTGESGTERELLARGIHFQSFVSPRR